jgi:hypothetical protein
MGIVKIAALQDAKGYHAAMQHSFSPRRWMV